MFSHIITIQILKIVLTISHEKKHVINECNLVSQNGYLEQNKASLKVLNEGIL